MHVMLRLNTAGSCPQVCLLLKLLDTSSSFPIPRRLMGLGTLCDSSRIHVGYMPLDTKRYGKRCTGECGSSI